MRAELSLLQRETERLKVRIGTTGTLRPVYRLIDDTGEGVTTVDINGNPTEPGEDSVTFDVLEAPFCLLAQRAKHTVLPHGRGAGISNTVGRYTLGLALEEPCRILCAREIQLSLRESVWYLLASIIDGDDSLRGFFIVQNDGIYARNGSQFLFRGIRTHTVEAIKSTEAVKFCWVEESQSLSRRSLNVLVPTVRAGGARFFWSINPRQKTDPVHTEYLTDDRPDTARPAKTYTLYQNPLCPQTLLDEAELMRRRDPERHQHVYGGGFETYSEARIFHNVLTTQEVDIEAVIQQRIATIKVGHSGPMWERRTRYNQQVAKIRNSFGVGVDFGVIDPFAVVLTYLDETFGRLFVLAEYDQTGLDPDGMLKALREFPLPSPKWPVHADHRPELIAYLFKHGIAIKPAVKLPILDRIDRLKQLDIIVSPDCPRTAEEFGLYSWAQTAQGIIIGDQAEDANNHAIDAIAYSLGAKLKGKDGGGYGKLRDPWR